MRIAVLADFGEISNPLVKILSESHQVAVVRENVCEDTPFKNVTFIKGSVGLKDNQLWQNLKDFRAEIIVDLVAKNQLKANEVIDNCRSFCKRAVVLSTSSVYAAYERFFSSANGPIEPTPIKETGRTRTSFESFKRQNKESTALDYLHAETAFCAQNEVICTVLRSSYIFSPDIVQRTTFENFNNLTNGLSYFCMNKEFANWTFDFTYIDNLVEGIRWAIMQTPTSHTIYNISSKQCLSQLEYYQIMAQELDWQGFVGLTNERDSNGLNFNQSIRLDITKIVEAGYKELVSAEDAVKKVINLEKYIDETVKSGKAANDNASDDQSHKDVVLYHLQTLTEI
ncbi:MAG: NAD(P)-dependent oxidoreductase [Parachlamydiales bacterium]|nr:NAD(P)-dependent oxidoreductase [Parachlamydiales bacterium]